MGTTTSIPEQVPVWEEHSKTGGTWELPSTDSLTKVVRALRDAAWVVERGYCGECQIGFATREDLVDARLIDPKTTDACELNDLAYDPAAASFATNVAALETRWVLLRKDNESIELHASDVMSPRGRDVARFLLDGRDVEQFPSGVGFASGSAFALLTDDWLIRGSYGNAKPSEKGLVEEMGTATIQGRVREILREAAS